MGRLSGRTVLKPPHPSVAALWARYRERDPAAPADVPVAYFFCDNRADAEECLGLVIAGRKRGTASALVGYEMSGDPVPRVGDFAVLTDFDGLARAVIRNEEVTIRRFGDVDEAFAAREGEGDGTLASWREGHESYFTRRLAGTPHGMSDDLLIVCEAFDLVFQA